MTAGRTNHTQFCAAPTRAGEQLHVAIDFAHPAFPNGPVTVLAPSYIDYDIAMREQEMRAFMFGEVQPMHHTQLPPAYVAELQEVGRPEKLRQWLTGDWDIDALASQEHHAQKALDDLTDSEGGEP